MVRRRKQAELERDLKLMFGRVRRTVGAKPPADLLDGRSIYVHTETTTFAIQGDNARLFRMLQRELAGSSRIRDGMSLAEADGLLLQACEDAIAGTIDDAIDTLFKKAGSPMATWIVAEAIAMMHIPTGRLEVGRVTYSDRVPRKVALKKTLTFASTYGFVAPVAVVDVQARDRETARLIAGARFAESGSILDLLDAPKPMAGRLTIARREDGTGGFNHSRGGWIINDGYVDSKGRLVAPFRQLSRAAARDESDRSDWERRVLAATRWYSRACRSEWAADRLASLMVALECLFVEDISEQGKGRSIAKRFTERFRLNELTREAQVEWLITLYRARNAAVHEGREFYEDLEVDRLMHVTRFAIRHMTAHLAPGHRPRNRSCRTFAEAMRCSLK